MNNILKFLAGGLGAIFFLGFAIVQAAIGYLGIEYHLGSGWALGLLIAAFTFQFSLPLTIGTFFGAVDVLGWHWFGALLITLPGLLFMIPGAIGMGLVGLASMFKGKSTQSYQTQYNYDEPKNVTPTAPPLKKTKSPPKKSKKVTKKKTKKIKKKK
tara:strand:+ start:2315 stop:2782 length:468 start_codon:yes stop_codon:yes gene_type:complete